MVDRNEIPIEPDIMTLRYGHHKPTEGKARKLAGGASSDLVPWLIPWTTPTKPRIVYPQGKNRPTKIPLESDWSPFRSKRKPKEYPQGWDTAGSKDTGRQDAVPIPDPEGGMMPESFVVREVNVMTFDDRPWLEGAPTELLAKIGYTQHDNNVKADKGGMAAAEVWHSGRLGVPNIKHTTVTRRAEWPAHRPGSWDEWDRDQRKASPQKPATEDASQPPKLHKDSLSSLRGRFCRNCLKRLPEDTHGRVRYCGEQCRNSAENARRRGLVGTIRVGDELGYEVARGMVLAKWQLCVDRVLCDLA